MYSFDVSVRDLDPAIVSLLVGFFGHESAEGNSGAHPMLTYPTVDLQIDPVHGAVLESLRNPETV